MFLKVGKGETNVVSHKVPFAFHFPVKVQSIRVVVVEIE